MLTEVMGHFGLVKEFPKAGYYENDYQKQMFKDIKATIHLGKLVALTGIIGCGKTTTLRRLFDVLETQGKNRATVFSLEGIVGSQREYIEWLLSQCTKEETQIEDMLEAEAIDLLATLTPGY